MSEKTSHTPGPWESTVVLINNAANRVIVRQKLWGAPAIADCGEETPRSKANARIMAAALEMKEAIEMVLDASEDGGDMDDIDWNQLRAALDKAEKPT